MRRAEASGLHICLVSREYPGVSPTGGIGTYTQNLARALAARGHRLTVVARAEPGGPEGPFEQDGVQIEPLLVPDRYVLPAFNRYGGLTLRTLPFILAAGRRFAELDARTPFDLVEVPEYQGWGLGVARAARCPVLVRLHLHTALMRRLNEVKATFDARVIHALEAATLRRGTRLLANSRALARSAAADFGLAPASVGVLPLGIDCERFRPEPPGWLHQQLGLAPEAAVLLYVGRLERRKGIDVLLRAFVRVAERQPDAVLVLAGADTATASGGRSYAAQLAEQATSAGLGDRVRWLGPVAYEALPRYYAGADLVVAPSPYEPFGMIYLEAMAAGKPAVGCAAGGAPEVLRDGETGLLVKPNDSEALAAALNRLLEYPELAAAIGARGRHAAISAFSLPVIARRTEAVYRALLQPVQPNFDRLLAEGPHAASS